MWKSMLLILAILSISASCNKNGSSGESANNENNIENNRAKITADNPFEGQPNEFCTVIRRVPGQEIGESEDAYCLIDVCLDEDETTIYSINLGTIEEPVLAAYKLIKVFETPQAALEYAGQFSIVDVVME